MWRIVQIKRIKLPLILILELLSYSSYSNDSYSPVCSLNNDYVAGRENVLSHISNVENILFRENCNSKKIKVELPDPTGLLKTITVEYKLYTNTKSSKKDGVVIFPPTGGATILDSRLALRSCKAGFNTLIMSKWTGSYLGTKVKMRAYYDNIKRGVTAFDYALKNILKRKVGLFGASLGGICAATAAIIRPLEVKAIHTVAAGIDIPGIIAESNQEGMKANRERRLKKYNLKTTKDYENLIRDNFDFHINKLYNPIAAQIPHKAIIVKDDKLVPEKKQHELRDVFINTDVKFSKFGHIGAIVKENLMNSGEVIDFFKDKLD